MNKWQSLKDRIEVLLSSMSEEDKNHFLVLVDMLLIRFKARKKKN